MKHAATASRAMTYCQLFLFSLRYTNALPVRSTRAEIDVLMGEYHAAAMMPKGIFPVVVRQLMPRKRASIIFTAKMRRDDDVDMPIFRHIYSYAPESGLGLDDDFIERKRPLLLRRCFWPRHARARMPGDPRFHATV